MILSTILAGALLAGVNDSSCDSSTIDVSSTCISIRDSSGNSIPASDLSVEYLQLDAEENNGQVKYQVPSNLRLSRDVWGASYATSTEILWVNYVGQAYAAGNVYQGQRIVEVCIWYTQNGNRVSWTACSDASSDSGSWLPGNAVFVVTWDSLNWNAPHTIFNIRTVRISPLIV